jgi:hypothetical protein
MIDLRKIFRRKNTVEIEPLTVDELFEDKFKENIDPDIMVQDALNTMIEEREKERGCTLPKKRKRKAK